ncbi:glutamyl-tRNA reductase [Haloarcula halophila]|uniref:glutamyl-tRNA reductase n=1 Tax=Halomicroarcula sp. GCM10025335 TaxID=3252668 RepID=UPI0023E37BBB|nr:glutamyl-tRNA reductase [Halomicroarcula sp. DFY41]
MSVNDDTTEPTPDVEQALGQLAARGAEVRAEQLNRALTRLRADGELSAEQVAALEQLSERLVDRLLALPEETLREAANRGEEDAVETAMELFG